MASQSSPVRDRVNQILTWWHLISQIVFASVIDHTYPQQNRGTVGFWVKSCKTDGLLQDAYFAGASMKNLAWPVFCVIRPIENGIAFQQWHARCRDYVVAIANVYAGLPPATRAASHPSKSSQTRWTGIPIQKVFSSSFLLDSFFEEESPSRLPKSRCGVMNTYFTSLDDGQIPSLIFCTILMESL